MIGLLCFALAVLASPFKSKLRLQAENADRQGLAQRGWKCGAVRNFFPAIVRYSAICATGAARHRPCGGALDEGHCACQIGRALSRFRSRRRFMGCIGFDQGGRRVTYKDRKAGSRNGAIAGLQRIFDCARRPPHLPFKPSKFPFRVQPTDAPAFARLIPSVRMRCSRAPSVAR
jgi:hypothetical protein